MVVQTDKGDHIFRPSSQLGCLLWYPLPENRLQIGTANQNQAKNSNDSFEYTHEISGYSRLKSSTESQSRIQVQNVPAIY